MSGNLPGTRENAIPSVGSEVFTPDDVSFLFADLHNYRADTLDPLITRLMPAPASYKQLIKSKHTLINSTSIYQY